MTKSFIRGALVALGCVLGTIASAQTHAPVDVPYVPGVPVREAVSMLGTWAEVYDVSADSLSAAVEQLQSEHIAPPALGVVLPDGLHATIKGVAVLIPTKHFEAHRDGLPVTYDQNCKNVAQRGDTFTFHFGNKGKLHQLKLSTTVIQTYAFAHPAWAPEEEDLMPVPAVTQDNCHSLDERRVLLKGTMSWEQGGQTLSRPILMQTVQLKAHEL